MPEIKEMVAVGMDAQHPCMRMVLGTKFLPVFSNGQRLTAHIDAGVIKEKFVHHFLGYKIMHVRWSLNQYLIKAELFHDIKSHFGIRRLVSGCA